MSAQIHHPTQSKWRAPLLFAGVALLFVATSQIYTADVALQYLIFGLLSAVMAVGVNIQWGYAGLFNTGVMGFTAVGGLAVVLVATPPQPDAWAAGGPRLVLALLIGALGLFGVIRLARALPKGPQRGWAIAVALLVLFFLFRYVFDAAVAAIEAVNPAAAGNIGGLGLPTLLAWPAGAALAALAAWAIGKVALGLRSDYLAIATLGIAEIIVTVLKNEDWLARGVKNVIGINRPWPVPREIDLQRDAEFVAAAQGWGMEPMAASILWVKLLWVVLFVVVLAVLIWASELALKSPWGRMMRAIRDNEDAARAMGKDVTRRHLQIFVIGSAVIGFAGAMMVSLDGQLTPSSFNPLRYTFLIWVMVVVGGSGNNWGSVLGGLLVGWLWLIVENAGPQLMHGLTAFLPEGGFKAHLIGSAAHMRLLTMGVILLLVLRFSPRGLLPEK